MFIHTSQKYIQKLKNPKEIKDLRKLEKLRFYEYGFGTRKPGG